MSSAAAVLPPAVARAIQWEAFRSWRSLHRYGFEREDLHQDLALHWLRRHRRYDARRSSLATFSSRVCRNRTLQLIADATAEKRGGTSIAESLSTDFRRNEEGEAVELGKAISEDSYALNMGRQSRPGTDLAELRLDIARVLAGLPASLAGLAHRLAFQSVTSAAQAMGISRATAYRNVAVLRAAFVEAGLDLYVIRRCRA